MSEVVMRYVEATVDGVRKRVNMAGVTSTEEANARLDAAGVGPEVRALVANSPEPSRAEAIRAVPRPSAGATVETLDKPPSVGHVIGVLDDEMAAGGWVAVVRWPPNERGHVRRTLADALDFLEDEWGPRYRVVGTASACSNELDDRWRDQVRPYTRSILARTAARPAADDMSITFWARLFDADGRELTAPSYRPVPVRFGPDGELAQVVTFQKAEEDWPACTLTIWTQETGGKCVWPSKYLGEAPRWLVARAGDEISVGRGDLGTVVEIGPSGEIAAPRFLRVAEILHGPVTKFLAGLVPPMERT